ncbi:hypothetical protein [Streptomyces sp. NPDC093149]|uniref:hypothetical protein n=1 Tax=Streptomyces sp. NPDC093149 TaxID=3366031 RepID=UPI0037F6E050
MLLFSLAFVVPYNGLVRKRGAVGTPGTQIEIEVQLKRRATIWSPNRVETVSG